jgi:hypothetical protein
MPKRFCNGCEASELFRLGSITLYLRLHGRYSGYPLQINVQWRTSVPRWLPHLGSAVISEFWAGRARQGPQEGLYGKQTDRSWRHRRGNVGPQPTAAALRIEHPVFSVLPARRFLFVIKEFSKIGSRRFFKPVSRRAREAKHLLARSRAQLLTRQRARCAAGRTFEMAADLVLGRRAHQSMGPGEHVVAAASANEVGQRDKVGRTCSPTMRRCGQSATVCFRQVVIFSDIYAPDILIVFPRKISLTRFCARRDGISVLRGDQLGRETAATAHGGLYADTMRTRNSMHIRNSLCIKDIQLFSC